MEDEDSVASPSLSVNACGKGITPEDGTRSTTSDVVVDDDNADVADDPLAWLLTAIAAMGEELSFSPTDEATTNDVAEGISRGCEFFVLSMAMAMADSPVEAAKKTSY